MILQVGTLAVVLTIIAVGNAQQGPPGPPGLNDRRFPKLPGSSGAAAPGHNVPEEHLIYPDVPMDTFVAGAPVNPDDPQQLINAGPEHHTFSDPRGPTGFRVPFRRFFPGREIPREYQSLGQRVDIQNDMEP
ncbi:uncharacterized protein LOC117333614 [Pecten maximus]|uniref:uncharacterized protein LOC117333614 n=1 Tax=Pecten maximus TaxID=6579 RepID=UPI001458E21D|nr:uncharacterized protein LOC117333614 [Pecten maximus]